MVWEIFIMWWVSPTFIKPSSLIAPSILAPACLLFHSQHSLEFLPPYGHANYFAHLLSFLPSFSAFLLDYLFTQEHFILLMTMPICLQDLRASSYLLGKCWGSLLSLGEVEATPVHCSEQVSWVSRSLATEASRRVIPVSWWWSQSQLLLMLATREGALHDFHSSLGTEGQTQECFLLPGDFIPLLFDVVVVVCLLDVSLLAVVVLVLFYGAYSIPYIFKLKVEVSSYPRKQVIVLTGSHLSAIEKWWLINCQLKCCHSVFFWGSSTEIKGYKVLLD